MSGRKATKSSGVESCDVCGRKSQISSKCDDCEEHLCSTCTTAHKGSKSSKHHKIVEYEEGVSKKIEYCLNHPLEEITMFCSQCIDVVCKLCIITTHNAHRFSDLRSVVNIKRGEITDCLTLMKDRYLPVLKDQVAALEELINQSEMKEQNIVKQIQERGDDIRNKVQGIVNKRIAESKQNVDHCKIADAKDEINKYILHLNGLIDENESRITRATDVEVLRSAKKLLNIDLEADVKAKLNLAETVDVPQYKFEYGDLSEKVLEDCVGYLREEDSELEQSSDIVTESEYTQILAMPSLIDMSEVHILTSVFTVYEHRNFSQYQHGVLIKFGLKLSNLLERKVSPAFCRDVIIRDNIITLYSALGDFFHFSGYFKESENIYRGCIKSLSGVDETSQITNRRFHCLVKLLGLQLDKCCYSDAKISCTKALKLLETLQSSGVSVHSAALYAEQAELYSSESRYAEALDYCDKAIQQLSDQLSSETTLNVLLLCMKVCSNADNLKPASVLAKYATKFAREKFGVEHPSYAHALDCHGWYLLKIDLVDESIKAYESSLAVRKAVFGSSNVLVARSIGELSYALYVKEYTSGNFDKARELASQACSTLEQLLPNDSMMLCSAYRAKALIVEEIALDSESSETRQKLLKESEKLHTASLQISKKTLGDKSIVTSNHYSNLGRLYQSMKKYNDAEKMLLTSINIHEELLGTENSDLATKLENLASLYTYDMQQYEKAEKLYQRSIAIIIKIYGSNYSGLKFDYRGLKHISEKRGDKRKEKQYSDILKKWQESQTKITTEITATETPSDLNSVIHTYFRLKK